jgi:dTDP-D-glucose 4,6-dehydratase
MSSSESKEGDRPSILVLGGVGQIGRNFVKHCVDNSLCSFIRVADKQLSVTSYFSPACKEAFEHVEFTQADLTKPAHLDRVFKDTAKTGQPVKFDYVFNLAAETKYVLCPPPNPRISPTRPTMTTSTTIQ